MLLPYPAMPATTPSSVRRTCGRSSGPKRSAFSSATGRAPIVKMSRMMPPTPVAAPWYGSMNDGWLCDSILNTAARPSPMSTAPGVLARALQHARPFGRQRLQVDAGALVAAVLGPHHREDPELRQVRLAAEQRDDARVLVGLEAVTVEGRLIEGHGAFSGYRLLAAGYRRFLALGSRSGSRLRAASRSEAPRAGRPPPVAGRLRFHDQHHADHGIHGRDAAEDERDHASGRAQRRRSLPCGRARPRSPSRARRQSSRSQRDAARPTA